MEDHLQKIKEAVIQYQQKEITGLIQVALDVGIAPERIINEALIAAMDVVGGEFAASNIFIPEMLVAAMTMKKGLEILRPLLQGEAARSSKGKFMIASVKGDLHDIGKNIVSMMVEGAGLEVIDLGVNIDGTLIVQKVKECKPDILGLCALLTTTMPEMGKVIDLLAKEQIRDQVKVLVGGAPVNASFAKQIGADGYGVDASAAADLCKAIVQKLRK